MADAPEVSLARVKDDAKRISERASKYLVTATSEEAVNKIVATAQAELAVAIGTTTEPQARLALRNQERELDRRAKAAMGRILGSQWIPAYSQPPEVGTIFDERGNEHLVSFKVGRPGRPADGHTLIADGDLSEDNDTFNKRGMHNHYGEKSEAPDQHFAEDRGAYSGPDH